MEKEICKRFKEIEVEIGLKGSPFADSLGIQAQVVSDIEREKREPSKDVLLRIASKYLVNLHWLLTGCGEMFLSDQAPRSPEQPEKSSVGVQIDQRFEKIEAQIAKIKDRLMRSNTDFPDSGMFASEPEPEYDTVRVCSVDDVAAGPPIPQSEDLSDYADVPRRLIKTRPEDYYAAHIQGQSMTAAGIPDGCWALIRKSDVPRNGAIHVVRHGGRSTLKRLREHEDRRWTLHFEDDTNRSIEAGPGEDYQVQGNFVAVLPGVK
jgi:SOS-response transcriptional repressor LexA